MRMVVRDTMYSPHLQLHVAMFIFSAEGRSKCEIPRQVLCCNDDVVFFSEKKMTSSLQRKNSRGISHLERPLRSTHTQGEKKAADLLFLLGLVLLHLGLKPSDLDLFPKDLLGMLTLSDDK